MTRARIHPAVAYSGPLVVGGATLAVSAYYQWHLAMLGGMGPILAVSLPIALDWSGGVASIFWLAGTGEVRRWGRIVAVWALAASTLANVAAHGLMHGAQWSWLGAIYPVVYWVMVKLALLYQQATPVQATRPRSEPQQRPQRPLDTSYALASKPSPPARPKPDVHDEAAAWALAELREGRTGGWKRIRAALGEDRISEHHAKQAARAAKEQHETPRPRLVTAAKEA